MSTIFTRLFGFLKPFLLFITASVVIWFTAKHQGRKEAKEEVKQKAIAERLDTHKNIQEVDDEVRQMDTDTMRDYLRGRL